MQGASLRPSQSAAALPSLACRVHRKRRKLSKQSNCRESWTKRSADSASSTLASCPPCFAPSLAHCLHSAARRLAETSKSSQLFRSSSRTPSPQLVTRLKVEDKDENGEPSSEEEEEQADSQRLEKDDKRAVTSPQCPKTPAAPAPFPYTPPANTSRRETYDLVLQNVPAVHPAYLVHLLNIPDFHADANESVAELLTNEYPLARGGWKQGGVTPAAEFTMKWRTRQAEVPTMPTVPRREPAEEPAVVYRPVVVPTRQAPSPTRQYTTPGPFDAFGLGYGYQKAGTGIFGGGGFGGAARGGSWSGGKGARADQARRSSQTLGEGSDGRDEPAEVKRQRLVTAALKRAHSESRSQTQG